MNIKILAATATPLVAGVMLLGMASGASAGTYNHPDAVELTSTDMHSTFKPHTFYIMYADGMIVHVSGMHWTSWTHSNAVGTGGGARPRPAGCLFLGACFPQAARRVAL